MKTMILNRFASTVLLVLFAAILLCLNPAPAAARVTHFVRATHRGVLYEYCYEELLQSYVLHIIGQQAPLYKDYASKRPVAFLDNKNGYVDYGNVLQAYALSIITGVPFDMNSYTSGNNALIFEMPPSVIAVTFDGTRLVYTPKILVTPFESAANGDAAMSLGAVTADKTDTQQILTGIRYSATVAGQGNFRYAWYVYKDGELYLCSWYTTANQTLFVPTRAGRYKMQAWVIGPDGSYLKASSDEIEITSPVSIVIPDLKWRGSLSPLTEPVVALVQHHMAHSTWDIYNVHDFHLTRTFTTNDGSTGFWPGIGYNYFIGFDGTIYEGRGRMVGAHAGPAWNRRTLGIGFQGNIDRNPMTDAQMRSGAWLNAILIVEEKLSIDDIIGHRDLASTSCPGRQFRMDQLKAEVLKLLPPEYAAIRN